MGTCLPWAPVGPVARARGRQDAVEVRRLQPAPAGAHAPGQRPHETRSRRLVGSSSPRREYFAVVRDARDQIALGTERLTQRQRSGVLTVGVSPDFAARWLVGRLGRFAESHPDIDPRVAASDHRVDFAREDVELSVRHDDGRWLELEVQRLCAEQLFPVCSPKLDTVANG